MRGLLSSDACQDSSGDWNGTVVPIDFVREGVKQLVPLQGTPQAGEWVGDVDDDQQAVPRLLISEQPAGEHSL